MDRERHIKNRNLIVAETFDEFAKNVESLNFTVEDIVAYVTSISRVFYWMDTESVWGVLGFVWDHEEDLSDEEALLHPNLLYRLNQVTADGENIEMDEQWLLDHKTKKGYGHFVATTIPFTIIPSLPDGYRITQLRSTFNSIEANYIEVQKSDWSNLTEVNYLVRPGQGIKIDLTGANLSSNKKTIIDSTRNTSGSQGTSAGAIVYIKGDLSNATSGTLEYSGYDSVQSWTSHHTIVVDDDNRDLHIPVTLNTSSQFYCQNKEGAFDITEWLLMNDTPAKSYLTLLAASKEYIIRWAFVESLQNAGGGLQISPWSGIDIYPDNYKKTVFKITNPTTQTLTPSTITIDATDSNGVIREDKLFGINNAWYNRNSSNDGVYTYNTYLLNPIEYIGEVNSITMYNPFSYVKDDDSWPTYNQSLVDKLSPIPNASWNAGYFGGYFMYASYIYLTKPSPYTIDCSSIKRLNLFEKTRFYVSDYSNFRAITKDKYALEVVKLINVNLDTFAIGTNIGDNYPRRFYFTLPTMETLDIADNRTSCYFIPLSSTITFNHWYTFGYDSIYVEDFTHVAFKFKYIDGRSYDSDTISLRHANSIYFKPCYGITEVGTSVGPINMYEFDERILNDIDFLKAAKINTFQSIMGSREVKHPFICSNPPYSHVAYSNTNINISSDFVFIYKSNISLTNYHKWKDVSRVVDAFVNKILPGVQVNDTDNVYTITLTKNIYDSLTDDQKDYIINTLNYTLTWTTN